MHYRHIVFDMDGTLVDTERTEMLALQRALRETIGQERPYDEIKVVFGTTGRLGLKKLGYTQAEIDRIYPRWYDLSLETIGAAPLFDGVTALLRTLHDSGYTLGVVTSRGREEYRLGAQPNGLDALVSCAICMEDTEEHKPHPAPLLQYLARTGAEKKQTLYVGDSPFDMECAAAAGVDSALALWGAQIPTLPATHYLHEPAALLALLAQA